MKTAKKQFLASVVSLLLCVSMLVGTTFAWFTDSVSSNNNIIKSGNLDVTLEYFDGTRWQPVEEGTSLINNDAKWEPGFAQVVYLRIANAGSLALKYQLSANILDTEKSGVNVFGDSFKLSDYIKFGVLESDTEVRYSADKAGRDAAVADVDASAKLISSADKSSGKLLAGESTYVTYVVYMPASVGNVANHNGRDIPEIKLGVNVAAIQLDYEGDDFGTDYDDATTYPVVSAPVTRPAAGSSESVSLKAPVENAVEVVLPAAVVDALPAGVTSMGITHSEPKVDTANNSVTFDSIEVVDQNGNVIDFEAINNNVPVTVKFNVGDAFNVGELVVIYHDDEIVASATVDADKNITYTTTHFCEVVVAYNDGVIDTAKEFLAAVGSAKDGDVITLAADITFNKEDRTHNSGTWYDGLYYVGDQSFTIDLGGHTVTQDGAVNDYLLNFRNAGDKDNVITIKNGTLDSGDNAFCALCTSATSTKQTTINAEGVNFVGNVSNGSVLKIRGGAVLNLKADSTITGKNSYLGIECVASTVNIYDGAKIYMNGTSSYNGCLAGVCAGGTINVYGGYGKGVKGGFIAMTSGGTINVYGGEWIANTDGSVGDNSNLYVLTSQNNKYESGYVGASVINVYGGTFRGGMDAWILNDVKVEKAELNIKGGSFNADPSAYVVDGFVCDKVDGMWTVARKSLANVTDANGNLSRYDSLADAFAKATDGAVITLNEDVTLTETLVFANDVKASLDLKGNTISGKLDTLIKLEAGKLDISNGSIANVHEAAAETKYSVVMSGNAVASFKDVNIETSGTGIYLYGNAKITELNANVLSYMTVNGYCIFDAIALYENARIDLISGGNYESKISDSYIKAWFESNPKKYSGTESFTIQINGDGASVGEIAGGTFLNGMDKTNNGAVIHVNNGSVEKISGGYFGFSKTGLSNPIRLLFINNSGSASIGAITGGTFEKGSLQAGFGCDFAGIVENSGCSVVETGKTVDVNIQFSTKVTTYTLKVVEVVAAE